MYRVRLVHWTAEEAPERAAQIQTADYAVDYEPLTSSGLRALREELPDAIIIDLSRVPSQGRDLGLNLRKYKATRHVPLVFVGGAPEKIARVQELLPDAVYTTWDEIGETLPSAVENPPLNPIVPASTMAGYSGTPLPKKLGIKPYSTVTLDGAPPGFEDTLGEMPKGVALTRVPGASSELTLWFVTTKRELVSRIEAMFPRARNGGLWIVWPKKASGVVSDLSQTVVRKAGLDSGLVDFKVAAIDATWSGLRFTQRNTQPDT